MRHKTIDIAKLIAEAALALLCFPIYCFQAIAAPPATANPHGEVAYVTYTLDPAQTGPTYTKDYIVGRSDIEEPRYDALFLQRLPGGKPTLVTDCRHSAMLGTKLHEISFDSTGRYIALISNPPKPAWHSLTRPRLLVYDLQAHALSLVGRDTDAFWWSPSGSRLLISTSNASGHSFTIYDAGTRKTTRIKTGSPDVELPLWSDGSKSVLYTAHTTSLVELNLMTGRKVVRWRHQPEVQFDASPYSRAILASDGNNAFGLSRSRKRPVPVGLGEVDESAAWSPDGKLVAIRDFSAILAGDEPLSVGTDQWIYIWNCTTWKPVELLLSYRDGPSAPYRYHLLGWSRNQRWLLMRDQGDYMASLSPWLERITAYDRHTKNMTSVLTINAWVGAAAWHADD